MRARANEYPLKFCEYFEQKPNFASTSKFGLPFMTLGRSVVRLFVLYSVLSLSVRSFVRSFLPSLHINVKLAV